MSLHGYQLPKQIRIQKQYGQRIQSQQFHPAKAKLIRSVTKGAKDVSKVGGTIISNQEEKISQGFNYTMRNFHHPFFSYGPMNKNFNN